MAIKRYNSNTGQWDPFGSPQLNPAGLGITPTTVGAVNVLNGAVTLAETGLTVVRNITVSTSTPTSGQGSNGDIWVQYI